MENFRNFSRLNFQAKLEVINNGRPIPELKDLLQQQKNITRPFQTEWYQKKEWLCGCATNNRLYCFPCLLFSTTDNVWTTGFSDLKYLSRGLNKHEKSLAHIHNLIAFKTFGTPRIDADLNEQRRLEIREHNAKVKENREILKHLIDTTIHLAKLELAFRGNNEGANSYNRGNYVESVYFRAESNENLANHLETSTVFSGLLNRVQNDLIEAVSDVIREDIKREIDAATFVAVEVDETTDVTNKCQISVILRYVMSSEGTFEVKEAFLGFDEVIDRRAPAIANYVFGVLEKYNCFEKLVAQTYDGAAVMASDLNGVQAKIKEKIPEATFIHCYAHELNLVLSNSAKCIPECTGFFAKLEKLCSFFSHSTKRAHLLADVVKKRLPRAEPTRWSTNSKLVQTVNMYQTDLRAMFNIISEHEAEWDGDTLLLADGFDLWLSKASTCFLLMVYEEILLKTDILFRILQNRVMDIGFCCDQIRDTMSFLQRQREDFDAFYERFEEKRVRLALTENQRGKDPIKDIRRKLFYNILDNVTVQMKARFDHFDELAFLSLVDCTKLKEISENFDDTKLLALSKYGKHFDFLRLKCDLVGLYSTESVRNECKSPLELLNFVAENDLLKGLPEAFKLFKLVLTIPATTASVEQSFSALKRIKKHSRNRTDQGRLSSLALLSIEMPRLLQLKETNQEHFYNEVIEKFVLKDRRMDFIYK
ncbi:zinc finger MYM-type protein 1-like isoform X2 [Bombina bombina]|uniref:zinc finger MYM-type protein 1-like isoform X2 n=1 Tax=Bombina bombina TaxID=8345 RepID=UPI00235AB65B|nr:zinc finger MYM-type protein 1-like isoform X2 [Bombina bombina]